MVLQSCAKPAAAKIPHLEVYLTTTTDQDGKFRLPCVVPGKYQLAAHEPGEPIAVAMQQAKSMRVIEVVLQGSGDTQAEMIVLPR